jgi:predicted XRE-type DNA-binding protein
MIDSDGNVYGPKGLRRQPPGTNGYPAVNTTARRFEVHRLVAETFIPNPEEKPQVAHWDGIKTHCSADNLRWASREENHDDRERHGAWGTKLSAEAVAEIRHLLDIGELYQYEIAEMFGITQPAVSQIKLGKSWKGSG